LETDDAGSSGQALWGTSRNFPEPATWNSPNFPNLPEPPGTSRTSQKIPEPTPEAAPNLDCKLKLFGEKVFFNICMSVDTSPCKWLEWAIHINSLVTNVYQIPSLVP
jgi:hypothetical protein